MRVPPVHVPGVDGPAVLQGACQAGGDLSQRGATGRRRRRGARHPPDHLDGNDERLLRGAHAPHGRQAARLDLRRRRQTPLLLGPSGHGRASCRPPPHPHRRARSDLRLVLPPVVPDGLPGRVRAGHRLCPSQAPRRPAAAGRGRPTLWAGAGRRGASLWRPHPLELCLRRRPRQRVARAAAARLAGADAAHAADGRGESPPVRRATLTGWQADSFGHGAHLLFLAATWLEVKGRPTAPEELAWDGKVEAAWKDVMSGCAAAAPTRCVVRSVLESARVETRQLYLAHEAKLLALAAARTVPALPWFNASWSGVRRGEMRHHDHTRIHFGDVGRLFLAQLTLNVLPILLSRPEETLPLLPPPRVEQRINLHRLRARPGG
mmetsp:Transcript_45313/g.146001  ORF Transcript_45313/g.146001 Transcript_45313/m.146001 type:complete len:378 (-) Transcript_45313:113-1246(-)